MPSRVPLLIRLQHTWSSLTDKLNLGRYALRMVDWLDKRRGVNTALRNNRQWKSLDGGGRPGVLKATADWIRRHWLLCSLCCLPLLSMPAVPLLRQWRCDRLVVAAENSLARREWRQALDTARSVLQIRRGDRRAQWVAFRASKEIDAPLAVVCGVRLCAGRNLNADESYEILQFLSGDHPQGAFLAAFAALTPQQQELPRFRALYAQLLIRRGRLSAAGNVLDSTPGSQADPALTLQRVRLSCALGTPQETGKARAQFLALRSAGAPEALAALRLLTALPDGVSPRLEDGFPVLTEWLESLQDATVPDRLIAFDQRWAQREPAGCLIAEATDRFGDQHLPELCAWLNRHGRHADVILLASGPAGPGNAGFSELVEAQLALGLLSAQTDQANPAGLTDPGDLALLRLRHAGEGEQDRTGQGNVWQEALEILKSGKQVSRIYELAKLCHAAGRYEDMQDVLAFAWQQRGGNLPLFADAVPVLDALARRDKLPEVIRILCNLRRYEARNPLLNARLLYFQCLAGDVTAAGALPILTALHKENPGTICAGMLALVTLLDGQTGAASELLDSLEPANPRASSVLAAMHGTALKLGGKTAKGEELLSKIRWNSGSMLPAEERCLLSLLKVPRT